MTDTISLHFRSDAPFQQIMDNGDNRIILLSFAAGQVLENHQVPMSLSVLVLNGRVRLLLLGETDTILENGQMTVLQPDKQHTLEAIEESTILLTLFANSGEEPEQAELAGGQGALHTSVHTNPQLMANIAPELKSLVDDHKELCEVLEKNKGNIEAETYQVVLDLIGDELNHHFVFEETILFPSVAKLLGGMDVGPIAMLIREHGKIRRLHASCLRELEEVNASPYAEGNLKKHARQLTNILLQHIEKEDKFIFPMASRILSKENLAEIENKLIVAANA
jgi:hemerythrin-like domain-containing protein/quercetin dioxygenase-like cupin family protein